MASNWTRCRANQIVGYGVSGPVLIFGDTFVISYESLLKRGTHMDDTTGRYENLEYGEKAAVW